jgi:hypothetical protein
MRVGVVVLVALVAWAIVAREGASAALEHRLHVPIAVRGQELDRPTATATATGTVTHTVTVTPTATPTVTPSPTGPPSALHTCPPRATGTATRTPTATATATGTPTATATPADFVVTIASPSRCEAPTAEVEVSAVVQARYQIEAVWMELGGREQALTFSEGRWEGRLAFGGLGFGEHVVTVAATDVFGNRGEGSTVVVND